MADTDHRTTAGEGGLPKVILAAADGARAEVYLHGAHVTSWIPAGGTERLFLSPRSVFKEDSAIRGGIPVIFPQFAGQGPLPKHGFARNMAWELTGISPNGAAGARADFRLSSSPATRAIWPASFEAAVAVAVSGKSLEVTLTVKNPGTEAITFTAALHTYLDVDDIRETAVRGLAGRSYRDSAAGGALRAEAADPVAINGEVDRIYVDVPAPLEVVEPGRATQVAMTGFADVVVWNPGAERAAKLSDMEPDGYVRMLCVEAAAIGKPITLGPDESWSGSQRLTAGRS